MACLEEAEDAERPLGCADTKLYEKICDGTQFNLSLPQRQFWQYASLWSMKQRWCLLAKWVQLKRSLVEGFNRDSFHITTCLKVLAYLKSTLNQIVSSDFWCLFQSPFDKSLKWILLHKMFTGNSPDHSILNKNDYFCHGTIAMAPCTSRSRYRSIILQRLFHLSPL